MRIASWYGPGEESGNGSGVYADSVLVYAPGDVPKSSVVSAPRQSNATEVGPTIVQWMPSAANAARLLTMSRIAHKDARMLLLPSEGADGGASQASCARRVALRSI